MNGASLKGCAYNAGWVKIRLRSPQRQSWRVLPGPQWTQRAHIIGVSQFCIPSNGKIQFWPKFVLFCWSNTTFWLFWSPFWASRDWFSLSQRWRIIVLQKIQVRLTVVAFVWWPLGKPLFVNFLWFFFINGVGGGLTDFIPQFFQTPCNTLQTPLKYPSKSSLFSLKKWTENIKWGVHMGDRGGVSILRSDFTKNL